MQDRSYATRLPETVAEYLVLDLEAPMMSFGGDVVDNRGVVRDFPARSMLTGLIGNALGLDRSDAATLDELQATIVHAAARVHSGYRRRDYQTARLFESESGWTRSGVPEGRSKSPSFTWDACYEAERGEPRKSLTHQRYRDHDADARTLVVLTLKDRTSVGDLDEIANALHAPARPLFIGRKASIPSRPLLGERLDSTSACAALAEAMRERGFPSARVQWHPESDTASVATSTNDSTTSSRYTLTGARRLSICDERRHVSGVHGGTRIVLEGTLVLIDDDASDDVLDVHWLSELSGASR